MIRRHSGINVYRRCGRSKSGRVDTHTHMFQITTYPWIMSFARIDDFCFVVFVVGTAIADAVSVTPSCRCNCLHHKQHINLIS